ncbi:MAG: hypothetical protein WBG48_11680 [Pricia sp.]
MIATTKTTVLAITVLLIVYSCSTDDGNKDYILGCSNDNIIELSKKDVEFNSEKDSVVITTGSDIWWLSEVQLEGSPQKDLAKVNVTAPNFIVEDSVFTVERRNSNEVHIAMSENKTDENRKLIVLLQQANCFDRIVINQVRK